ncbi:MAG TPA: hypothetical protein VHK28_01110 [Candidatus Limnocylindria bacterium]|nr:hypothetical protein [Candidatus Limnocylindria bacterium]
MTTRSIADRLDEAVDELLAGGTPRFDAEVAPLLDTAVRVSSGLPLPAVSERFEARLAGRLRQMSPASRGLDRLRSTTGRQRLIAAGAVSSAAVGMTITAFAVWRTTRRHASPVRLGHR